MRSSTFASFVALVASASAISITWPNTTDTNGTPRIDLSVSQTITWTSDSSDPATFKIELVSAPKDSTTNTAPAQTIDIASSVTTSDDKYVMPPPAGLIVNGTYQLFFYGAYNATTTGVIAESPFFIAAKVSGASATTSTGTGGSSPSPTSSTTTVTPSHKNAGATLRAFGFAGVLTGLAMLVL